MYHTTGFTRDEQIDICVRIISVERDPDAAKWPPCLGLRNSVAATLAYLRHNRTQSEIGESLGVSQPTICRA
jgi:Helix-turn-helix of DDE superfamily endonuclease